MNELKTTGSICESSRNKKFFGSGKAVIPYAANYHQIIPPNILDKDTPCDIVAACDGIINHMVVKNGEEVLNDGDAVKTGDVIVSGKVANIIKKGLSPKELHIVVTLNGRI